MKFFIVVFIVISAVIAIIKDSHPELTFIAQMMGVSWGALAGAFLAPFLYGLYWKGITKASVVVSFIWGSVIAIIQLSLSLGFISNANWPSILQYVTKTSIHSGVIAMVGGLIIVPIVSLFTKKMDKQELDPMFTCFEEKIEVPQTQSLK